ncbi:branched-chain amino acid ABC transporter substrate-binding protein [Solirubrobacter sp. CPCC 204708]|uniref:Branched-chain amino acid ABC transporter substrate-binding protein n=1 Tax=Solirubrobacter deserti TaxID=2282478 RepID=A0ABT4RST8_9ACTN|nr:branched-chain amino acid ABC transporter substrate-binding protein [Solirubrobacter deserti]MBE2316308.1 branched-chain amino acid ABC transporter substrate-binding protein [Solirubrobacter deserti]MDA0141515.1 branched-chain amino acid ABC transporter substrate-binding protein [Solirubrobacter deserti]
MAATSCLLAALALGVAACGDEEEPTPGGEGNEQTAEGKDLTIYSSLPLQGASRVQTEALVNGAKLALEQAGGKAGPHRVKYESLDDSTAQAGSWTPEAESANALKAAQDEATAVYIGAFNSGASKVSIPILSEAGVPQISPANTYVGLTTNDPGSEPGEPDKYYPTGDRTFARIVPKDTIQAAALVTLMKTDGCTKVAMTNDKEVYGAGLARVIELSAKEQGLELTSNDAIDKNASNYRSLAQKAKAAGADCFVYSGITANNAVQQFKDFAAALGSDAGLYGPDGVAETGFVSEKDGGIPASLNPQVKVTVATLSPDQYPPEGQEFFKQFTEKYGVDNPDPYAIYGYEAMKLALDAIERSGTGEKADIKKAIFETKDRASVLGTYSIDENGDTTLTDYGAYSVKDGELTFDQTIKAQAG